MTVQLDLPVLVVSSPEDPHADAVEGHLQSEGVEFARTSLDVWSAHSIEWRSDGFLSIGISGERRLIGPGTTVWWRRPGWFKNAQLSAAEEELARDECAVIFPGALDSAGVRWVDQPWISMRAGNRMVQLKLAQELGANSPSSVVTNLASVARGFVTECPTVAKTISSGPGLAPFVDRVEPEDALLVENAPVLLQQALDAQADWRIVTVGRDSFCWRRSRRDDLRLDWRAEDPGGASFEPANPRPGVGDLAVAIQCKLGLSFSVQDWLESGEECFFLEVNPQGQWLFLESAGEVIGRSLAKHLEARRQ
jgi:glutathione synthase/RimK-type ligase-like ATP-grasp enzyme